MPQLINWSLMREPYNWLIVALACSFAVVVVAIVSNGGRLPPSTE